jgi:hypothetical protein
MNLIDKVFWITESTQEMTLGFASSIANLKASSLKALKVKFIANGRFVNSFTFAISCLRLSVERRAFPTLPIPPAFDTAATSSAEVYGAIAA